MAINEMYSIERSEMNGIEGKDSLKTRIDVVFYESSSSLAYIHTCTEIVSI